MAAMWCRGGKCRLQTYSNGWTHGADEQRKGGHPKLAAVIALMKASSNWNIFMRNLNRAFPKREQQLELLLED